MHCLPEHGCKFRVNEVGRAEALAVGPLYQVKAGDQVACVSHEHELVHVLGGSFADRIRKIGLAFLHKGHVLGFNPHASPWSVKDRVQPAVTNPGLGSEIFKPLEFRNQAVLPGQPEHAVGNISVHPHLEPAGMHHFQGIWQFAGRICRRGQQDLPVGP